MKINSRKLALVSLILSYPQFSAAAENNVKQDPDSDTLIVTASGREEQQRKSTVTTQVIDSDQIERSRAESLTELLAQNSVGFFSEWSPGRHPLISAVLQRMVREKILPDRCWY